MSAFTEWLQSRVHRECDTVIDCYDQARQASAQAHHEAEQALADERKRVAYLESCLASHQARTEGAEAVVTHLRAVLEEEVSLDHLAVEHQDRLGAQLMNTKLVQMVLRNEAMRAEEGFYSDHMHRLADTYQGWLDSASQALGQERVSAA